MVEQILMDGGSSDNSLELIQTYGDHLTYWQSERDGGQTNALIRGFERATGNIFGWLNADDYLWDKQALYCVAEAFRDHPEADMVTGDLVFVNEEGRPIMIDMVYRPTGFQMRYYMAIPQQSTFWRRTAYERVGGLNPKFQFCMDFDLFQRMSEKGKILRIPHFLATFRLHRAAKTHTMDDIFRKELEKCLLRSTGRKSPGFLGKLLNLWIRTGSLLAETEAIVSGRKLPSYLNARIEPMRYYVRKKWGLNR